MALDDLDELLDDDDVTFQDDDITLEDDEPVLEQDGPAGPLVVRVDQTPVEITSVAQVEQLVDENVQQIRNAFDDDVKRARREAADMSDSEYWVCVVFQTREQKAEFLEKIKWDALTEGDKYIDGTLLAYTIGVELTSRVPPETPIRVDRRLVDLT